MVAFALVSAPSRSYILPKSNDRGGALMVSSDTVLRFVQGRRP
jgi:hypothetical protein